MKKETHVVMIRPVEDEESRWQIVNFAASQKSADALAVNPVDKEGSPISMKCGDILAAGPMEIVNPLMIGLAKIFVSDGYRGNRSTLRGVQGFNPLEFWEGAETRADSMLEEAQGHVDDRRIALALSACAESVIENVDKSNPYPAIAIKDVREWALGLSTKSPLKIDASQALATVDQDWTPSVRSENYAILAAAYAAEFVIGKSRARVSVDKSAHAFGNKDLGFLKMAEIVRHYIPAPVFLMARAKIPCSFPIPMAWPRSNPRRRR